MDVLTKHNVVRTGSGPQALLFSHGFGCNHLIWHYLVEAFSPAYTCVTYDLAGSGSTNVSDFNRERYQSLQGYADDAIAICEALKLSDVIHIGHSVSGMIAVLAANKRPDLFNSLVLIGPSPRYINDGDYYGGFDRQDIEELLQIMEDNYRHWSNKMGPVIMGNSDRPELGKQLADIFLTVDPDTASYFGRVTFTSDNRADLPRTKHPTLILQCDEDVIAPESVGRYVHQHIPNSEFILLDARGHCPNLSEPHQTIDAIRPFLQKHSFRPIA